MDGPCGLPICPVAVARSFLEGSAAEAYNHSWKEIVKPLRKTMKKLAQVAHHEKYY
jgi:hypothetical protein